MDPNYVDVALLRAREPGLRPPTRHRPPSRHHHARHQVATALRRFADRLDN